MSAFSQTPQSYMALGTCCSKLQKDTLEKQQYLLSEIMTRLLKLSHRPCCEQFSCRNYFLSTPTNCITVQKEACVYSPTVVCGCLLVGEFIGTYYLYLCLMVVSMKCCSCMWHWRRTVFLLRLPFIMVMDNDEDIEMVHYKKFCPSPYIFSCLWHLLQI